MRAFVALLALVALTACGFSPMYAPAQNGEGPIGPVQVSMIPGKAGHTLHSELERLLAVGAGSGAPRQLEVQLYEQVVGLALRLDESASRAELRLRAVYTLTPPDGGQPVRGSVVTVVNYEVPVAAFAATAAQDDARERAAETLAQRIRAELALKLARERRGT